jgi:hypothetical protein
MAVLLLLDFVGVTLGVDLELLLFYYVFYYLFYYCRGWACCCWTPTC